MSSLKLHGKTKCVYFYHNFQGIYCFICKVPITRRGTYNSENKQISFCYNLVNKFFEWACKRQVMSIWGDNSSSILKKSVLTGIRPSLIEYDCNARSFMSLLVVNCFNIHQIICEWLDSTWSTLLLYKFVITSPKLKEKSLKQSPKITFFLSLASINHFSEANLTKPILKYTQEHSPSSNT